jgi:peroxiredoxin
MSRVEIDIPAPDFELADFTGHLVKLSDFRGTANVLLVFNRGFT